MRKNIFKAITLVMLVLASSCQQPDELLPPVSRLGVNSITATFADGTGEFTSITSEEENLIIIPIPYFYPVSSEKRVTEEELMNMRVRANLDDNVIIEPALLYMDLTKDNVITVTGQRKEVKEYIVRGQIVKSSDAQILRFELPSLGLTGIIEESAKTISLMSIEDIEPAKADVTISYHATISPDPTEIAFDYDDETQFTVTAHDGTMNVYTVKTMEPKKLPQGLRQGSAKLLFAKQLKKDLGIAVDHLTGGLALTDDYIVLNTRNENSIYIDPITGDKIGEIELGSVKGSLVNFYNTSDADGNILINNLAPNAGSFKIWKLNSVTATPELFIEWSGGVAIGRKVSVNGSINGDAIITAPIHNKTGTIARWTVVGGTLTSQTPEIITVSDIPGVWQNHVDAMQISNSDTQSDYFVAYPGTNGSVLAWVNGETNAARQVMSVGQRYAANAFDYIEFNNARFAATNWVDNYSEGKADVVWLMEITSPSTFSGVLSAGTSGAVVWETPRNTYGATSISGGTQNVNGTGDVIMKTSEDGYFLYLYFLFTNGYVVGYQFDAIDF